eukprot:scaffold316_cov158-Amphora_coffeaeformis.AAC.7
MSVHWERADWPYPLGKANKVMSAGVMYQQVHQDEDGTIPGDNLFLNGVCQQELENQHYISNLT